MFQCNVDDTHINVYAALVFGRLSLCFLTLSSPFYPLFVNIPDNGNWCIHLWMIYYVCDLVSFPADLFPSFSTQIVTRSSAVGFSWRSRAVLFI